MGIKKNYVVPSTRLRCRSGRSGLLQSCYERAIRVTIHLLGPSNDDFGAYDGVIFSPKSVTPRIRRYFQHDHFIPIVGVGKRGEY